MAIVVPLSSQLDALRFPHTFEVKPSKLNGLTFPSVALVFQLRAIDRLRLLGVRGNLEDHYLERLDQELRLMLGL
jgi:mRNA interferase MazF